MIEILNAGGPLRQHLIRTEKALPDTELEIVFTGGGSLDLCFQKEMRTRFPGVSFGTPGHAAQSLVAQGIILNLLDPRISNDTKLAAKSYGIAHCAEYQESDPIHRARKEDKRRMRPHMSQQDIDDRYELPDTIEWLAKVGARVREINNSPAGMSQDIVVECGPGESPSQHQDDIIFRVPIYATDDPVLGSQNGHKTSAPGVRQVSVWNIPLSKELAQKISRPSPGPPQSCGLVKWDDKKDDWTLSFDYEFTYRWAGMLQLFEIHIPYGGYFKEGRRQKTHVARFSLAGDITKIKVEDVDVMMDDAD